MQSNIPTMLTSLDLIHIVMALCGVALGYAVYRLGKDNKNLAEKNQRERSRENRRFQEDKEIGVH